MIAAGSVASGRFAEEPHEVEGFLAAPVRARRLEPWAHTFHLNEAGVAEEVTQP